MKQKFKIIDFGTGTEYGTIIKEELELNWVWSKAVSKVAITDFDITGTLNELIKKNKQNCEIKVRQISKDDFSLYRIVFKMIINKKEDFTIFKEHEVEYKKEKGKRYLCLTGGDEELYINSKTTIGKEFVDYLSQR